MLRYIRFLEGAPMSGWKNKRTIMQRYDLTSEMYEERYAKEQEAKYLAALQNVSVAGCAVLDAGCGSGLFFGHVAGEANLVLGLIFLASFCLKPRKKQMGLKTSWFCRQMLITYLLGSAFLMLFSLLRCFRTCLNQQKL